MLDPLPRSRLTSAVCLICSKSCDSLLGERIYAALCRGQGTYRCLFHRSRRTKRQFSRSLLHSADLMNGLETCADVEVVRIESRDCSWNEAAAIGLVASIT